MKIELTREDLSTIRDAAPHLDLVAIRALRRAGYELVRRDAEPVAPPTHSFWNLIPRPMTTSALAPEMNAAD